MRLIYDPKTDRLQIRLRSMPVHESDEVEPGVSINYDEDGHIIGIDLFSARSRLTLEELTNVTYENTAIGQRNSLTLP
jgi:uncharacterized protein YuzE